MSATVTALVWMSLAVAFGAIGGLLVERWHAGWGDRKRPPPEPPFDWRWTMRRVEAERELDRLFPTPPDE